MTYLLIQGKWSIINLNQKKILFVKNFPSYTLKNRKLGMGMPFIQDGYSEVIWILLRLLALAQG